ncbi:hypothetical protein ABZ920_01245 [Streptomyces sp. NPDC046831]|uniref:hypothetical protein n=1 Tax=Streptomyces sp. NPDC046831 TaxID=3154805 RepID=UPI0033FBD704
MTDTTVAPGEQDAPAAGRLAELTAALAQDLADGAWSPGPLERRLAHRLLVATAGDQELTADRIRVTLWEGAVALHHVGDGRLAAQLAHLFAVADVPGATAARTEARALLERVAGEEGEHDRARS